MDLRECVARLVTLTVVLLTMWAVSLSWLVKDKCDSNGVYHGCNYGFIDSALVAGLAGGLYKVSKEGRKGMYGEEEGRMGWNEMGEE